MTWQDAVNAGFEVFGGLGVWRNVAAIWHDRRVAGVVGWPTMIFMCWGWWNLYYYPHLDQWSSFLGGLVIASGNSAWIVVYGLVLIASRTDELTR